MDAGDPFDLQRFVTAQAPVMPAVMAELKAGAKRSHWMWFVFPQLAALGRSGTARHYGIASLDEARAYLAHPVLGARLKDCCRVLLGVPGRSAHAIFGSPDDLKLRSCLTLFHRADPAESLFAECLARYYGGVPDAATAGLLGTGGGSAEGAYSRPL
ncbi:DUF1810 domain-containing protein [Ramlibacter sp.]|uniref:DUF1810 domain-containing protein n=1 Tax=Ramlibacter sp. TaxID=1917967 RepID=UPI00182C683D|nr:DUF1810 domain-containing protein [Ramlibacter sp.]MBA2672548.1 DUF1810 domain-containing protein [Ramlibacter sp.]